MSFLSDKKINRFGKEALNIEWLSNEIISQHSFGFSTFKEAESTITIQNIEYCFDRLSLCVYSHNLGEENFRMLGKVLTSEYEKKFNREEQKARLEYSVLFHMMAVNGCYDGAKIIKKIQPDFVLERENEIIGVEVTEFTTPRDKVMSAISKQNFGTGKSIEEIEKAAIRKHGSKAREYEYLQLGTATAVGRPAFNVAEELEHYASEVIKKFEIYKDSFAKYSEFVILCNGQHSMCLSNKYNSEKILSLAKEREPNLQGFTLKVLRCDDFGQCILDSFDV